MQDCDKLGVFRVGKLAILQQPLGVADGNIVTGDAHELANQQRIRFTNQLDKPQRFHVAITDPVEASLVLSDDSIVVAPAQVVTINAVTTVPRSVFDDGQATVRYLVQSDEGYRQEMEFILLGPFGSSGRQP